MRDALKVSGSLERTPGAQVTLWVSESEPMSQRQGALKRKAEKEIRNAATLRHPVRRNEAFGMMLH